MNVEANKLAFIDVKSRFEKIRAAIHDVKLRVGENISEGIALKASFRSVDQYKAVTLAPRTSIDVAAIDSNILKIIPFWIKIHIPES
jgi:hypothetical protein